MRLLSLALFLTLIFSQTQARTLEGVEIPEILPATSEHPELKLNGAALRKFYGIVNTYIGELYVENTSQSPSEIIESNTYKRMVFHGMLKKVSGRRMAKAMYDALQLNTTKEEAIALEHRLIQLIDMFDRRLMRGQEGYIEWVPGLGNRIVIAGEVRGILPGKDLSDAMLRIWIGDEPVGQRFKKQILGLAVKDLKKKKRKILTITFKNDE